MSTPLPTLDMLQQLAHERRALRIVDMPQVQKQIALTQAVYRNNWLGKTPDGAAWLEESVRRWALFGAQLALMNDPARPEIIWANSLPHTWHGITWPGANWGLDNPDNFYRYMFVDGASRYEISGQRRGKGPVQEIFLLYDAVPGTGVQTMEGAKVVSFVETRTLNVEADGSFLITIGPEPAASGKNHLQSEPDAKIIFIRDTLNDWATEYPNWLRVRRIDGPPAPPPRSDDAIAEEAAMYLKLETEYWLKWFQEFSYDRPANSILELLGRQGSWGQITTGWFKLEDDEAFVITMHPLSAAYVEMQIANVWTNTPDFDRMTNGLNGTQSAANADGTYTYVVSAKDPGLWNWIDTDGMHMGTFTLRWQNFRDPDGALDGAVRQGAVMKLADLKEKLPPETKWVSPAERKRQQDERTAQYALRFAN